MTHAVPGTCAVVFRSSVFPVAEAPADRQWMRAEDRASLPTADPFPSLAANAGD